MFLSRSVTSNIPRTRAANIYDLGKCKAGTPITVEMTVKDDVNSGALNFFVYGLDTDKFVEGYNKLNSGALNIESFTDTEITGTLNAAEDSIIYTSMTRAGKLLLTERKSARMTLSPSATHCSESELAQETTA